MANKNKGGREARKPKKDAKVKPVTLTSAVRPAPGGAAEKPKDA
jgi:hypothetical protein